MNTCRLCKKTNYDSTEALLPYGKGFRSNVHASCALPAWGADEFLKRISPWQLGNIPFKWLFDQDKAFQDRVKAIFKSWEEKTK